MDECRAVGVCYLDFSKAFYSEGHFLMDHELSNLVVLWHENENCQITRSVGRCGNSRTTLGSGCLFDCCDNLALVQTKQNCLNSLDRAAQSCESMIGIPVIATCP